MMPTLYQIPRQLGIHATHKGYFYLIDALQMALEDERNLVLLSKTMFEKIANKHNTDPTSVDRNLRTLVEQCWNSPFRNELLRICPYRLEKKPSVGIFIDIVYWHIKTLEDK